MQARDETSQQTAVSSPAAAAALDRPTCIEGMRTGSFTLRNAVSRRAAAFRQKHFTGSGPGGAASGMESEGLRQLKQLCDQLASNDSCVGKLLEVSSQAVRLCCCMKSPDALVHWRQGFLYRRRLNTAMREQ